MKSLFIVITFFGTCIYGQPKKQAPPVLDIQPEMFSISMVMMHDVVNPPAASRYYAYAMLGAYEIVRQSNSSLPALETLLKEYHVIPITKTAHYNYQIAAAYCIMEIAKRMLPSGARLEEQEADFVKSLRKEKYAEQVIVESVAMANKVAAGIIQYAATDGYSKLSAKIRYTPLKGDGYWFPTPPSYMEAVEPHWNSIRPMLIHDASQFAPTAPTEFSKDSNSIFYAMAKEVYDVSRHPEAVQLQIAAFWDCNPFVVSSAGHMSLGFKKISPGGHWMNICGIASKKAGLGFDKSVLLHTLVSLTLMDAFISCWDEKYRSNRIRPETYINKYIDLHWQPILQTPPFPEYTSGHSVISTAAAEMLSFLLGDHFSFTDNSEELFELKPRSFPSFRSAAEEAAISRLYGGIHFRDAIVNGQSEGRAVAASIIDKIKTAGITTLTEPSR